jgi:hypothetical protein
MIMDFGTSMTMLQIIRICTQEDGQIIQFAACQLKISVSDMQSFESKALSMFKEKGPAGDACGTRSNRWLGLVSAGAGSPAT